MPDIRNAVIPLTACRPHPANYNRHADAQITDLRASLRTFGQVRSVVVQIDPDSILSEPAVILSGGPQAAVEGYLIVAGHGLIAVTLERWATMTGGTPVLLETRTTPGQPEVNTPGPSPVESVP
jgi:hypothetical protein